MNIEIEVNGQVIKAKKGEMILDALKSNGIHVPTLCHMEGFKPSGACRICVVEVEGRTDLIPACSYPAEEWMKIRTHSSRVLKARRAIMELLLSCHSGGCITCERNQACELQRLAAELNVTEHRYSPPSRRKKLDVTSQAVIRDPSKCVLCGRCVRICEEVQLVSALDFLRRGSRTEVGTVLDKGLNYSSCISCGQCIPVCPTGALHEKSHLDSAVSTLQDPEKYAIALIDPALSVTLNEWFDYKPGPEFNALLATALRRIGFRKVYSAAWGQEYEAGLAVDTLTDPKKGQSESPLLVSSCPAFVRYIEQSRTDLLPNLLKIRPGRQIQTSLIRQMHQEIQSNGNPSVRVIYFTACTAAKSEMQTADRVTHGSFYPDFVLTGRELYKLIRLFGIRMERLSIEGNEDLFGAHVRSGYLPAVSGGYLEAMIRIYQKRSPDLTVPTEKLNRLRGMREIKECSCQDGNEVINLAAISGIAAFEDWMKESLARKKTFRVVEVMACPHGCINGGGQPVQSADRNLRARTKAIGETDDLYSGIGTREKLPLPINPSWKEEELVMSFSERNVIR